MSAEIAEIVRFLRKTAPFEFLEEKELGTLSRAIEIRYARADSAIIEAGAHNERLFVVRSGSVELRLAGKDLTARLSAGSCFAYPSLLRGGEVHNTTIALEDTLLYAIPADRFHALRNANSSFHQFFAKDEAERIRHALNDRQQSSGFTLERNRTGDLVKSSQPISCTPDCSIRDAVGLMHKHNVSTLMICQSAELLGIFSDKDLRNRVVAADHSLSSPISDVMTPNPRTLSTNASAAEAMAMMVSGGFRHIPLIDEAGALTGILSATDILSAIGNNAIDTGMMIGRSRNEAELIEAALNIPDSFASMVNAGMHAQQAMQMTSAMGEAAHRKAAQIAEEELGAPPCPYALVVFGSLARQEQLVGSDQDNGFVIADEADEAAFDYFAKLGARISDILDACGYVYCKGGIMVKNAEQRQTLSAWQERYKNWIANPDEDRILRATIFFDMRIVHGDTTLASRLREHTLARIRDNPLFVSYLARDAMRSKIPLGIFRKLVLESSDDGQKVFDAKRQAIMPVVDIVRVHALANGIAEVSTRARLSALAQAGIMNAGDAQSLEDAMLLINDMRIAHQAGQVEAGQQPDNLIAPDDLSPLEINYLKDAFALIRQSLDSVRRNFAGGIA